MKRKGSDAMAFFAQLLVLIVIFLLASYANAFLNMNQVAGNQIQLNHLIWFKETNKQNSSAKTALKATAEMQPSADSKNTNNALSVRHTASSTLQLVVASVDDKFLNGSTKPSANNFRQCHLFVKSLNKCQMEINKTETNNFWQCQLFVNVLIDSWQHKCRIEINKTQTNNSWQCRLFVNVLNDLWQQKKSEWRSTKLRGTISGNANRLSMCRLTRGSINAEWRSTKLRRTISGNAGFVKCVGWLMAAYISNGEWQTWDE